VGVRVKRLLLEPLPVSQADRSGSRIPPLGRTDPDDVGVWLLPQWVSPGNVMVPWSEPKIRCVPSSLAASLCRRSNLIRPWAPVNRPVRRVMVCVSTMPFQSWEAPEQNAAGC